jgi:ribulose-phosphate 3-epimerase
MAMIVASLLSADLTRLGEELAAVERAGADWVHVDVMDGHFVPNLAMDPRMVEAVRRSTSLPIDVHLMIEDPDRFVERFVAAGATHVSVHAEASIHLIRSLELIRACGASPGIALGPAAPLSLIEWSLDHADFVDLLAVNPGFGGQASLPSAFAKIRALRAEIDRRGLTTIVECDGGIGAGTIGDFAEAGVGAFVVGSALFAALDYRAMVGELRARAGEGSRGRPASLTHTRSRE